jgi:S-formylglutathione hydrolase FrmB
VVEGGPDDLLHLVATADPATLPRLLLRCGTEDHLLAQNRRFVRACEKNGVELDSGFGPGEHEWGYWDTEIRTVLDWLPVRGSVS